MGKRKDTSGDISFSMRMPKAFCEKLDKYAREEGINTRTKLINILVREYIKEKEKRE